MKLQGLQATSAFCRNRTTMRHWCFTTVTFLLSFLSGRVASQVSEEEAKTLIRRHLEQNVYSWPADEYEYKLSNFSLRFDRCQYVKMYDDEIAQDENSASPLATRHFAVYRLCPSDNCESCDGGVFGRYVTELNDYLAYTVAEEETVMEYMCNNCQEQCDENGQNCSGCGKICYHLQNMEANGYIDASKYIQCQKLELNDGEEGRRLEDNQADEEQLQLYIGPRCSHDGSRVLIGLFTDDECLEPYTDAQVQSVLQGELSYYKMAHTAGNTGAYCLSCKESDEDQNEADMADEDDVNEMCERVYDQSAKCESKYGLYGFVEKNREDRDFENQIENEFMVCNFIESLLLNSYTESGDINLEQDLVIVTRKVTKAQKVSFSLLSVIIVGLLASVHILRKKIESTIPKLDLGSFSTDGQFA